MRASSIVGFVGAGGIGQDLFVAIRKFYYTDVSAILLMIIVTVSIIDLLTEHIRHRLAPVEIVLAGQQSLAQESLCDFKSSTLMELPVVCDQDIPNVVRMIE